MDNIIFLASLHSVKIDREGEAKITLAIPSSGRDAILELSRFTEAVLRVSVSPEAMG